MRGAGWVLLGLAACGPGAADGPTVVEPVPVVVKEVGAADGTRVVERAAVGAADGPMVVERAAVVVEEEFLAPVFAGAVDAGELQRWLLTLEHRGWTAMTELRATGEHGGERLFFNDALARSWRAGAQVHPVGSAAVRELYSADLATLKGFAYMRKTGESGVVGEGWYWFEVFGTTEAAVPTVAEAGARGCVGCHAHAVDFVHSPDTPRADPQPLL